MPTQRSYRDARARVRPRTGTLRAPKKRGDLWRLEFSLSGERHYLSFEGSAAWDQARVSPEQWRARIAARQAAVAERMLG